MQLEGTEQWGAGSSDAGLVLGARGGRLVLVNGLALYPRSNGKSLEGFKRGVSDVIRLDKDRADTVGSIRSRCRNPDKR